jgi:hypothetical protein
MLVDGDVYSAHAYLALVGTQISIPSEGVFYFHASSGTRMELIDCLSVVFSINRGQWGYTSCVHQQRLINKIQNDMLSKFLPRILNAEEIARILQGNTVILSADEFKERVK